jgi:hypothetical protein
VRQTCEGYSVRRRETNKQIGGHTGGEKQGGGWGDGLIQNPLSGALFKLFIFARFLPSDYENSLTEVRQ